MSKINDMLAELCPNGVEFFSLNEIFDLKNGYTPSTKNPEFWTNGTINWFRMDDIRTNGRILSDSIRKVSSKAIKGGRLFEPNSLIVATSATIGEHALITVPFMCNQRFTCLTRKDAFQNRLDMKFVLYYADVLDTFCIRNTNKGGFSSVSMSAFKSFPFPVPPLDIQREIVRVLDSFTKLEAELEAELEARRMQYTYYRDQLLSHEILEKLSGIEIPIKQFGEVGTFTRGSGIQKKDFVEEGKPCIHYGQIYTRYDLATNQTISNISAEQYDKSKKAIPNDVIIAITSENFEDVCTPLVWEGDAPVAISGHSCAFHTSMSSRFVAYFMNSEGFRLQKKKVAKGTKVIEAKPADIAKATIPVPPLPVQQQVVDILDRFDALTTSLTDGLPAEIEARRQQYEHYRNKLLDFPRKEMA